jgi:hypothetical protein
MAVVAERWLVSGAEPSRNQFVGISLPKGTPNYKQIKSRLKKGCIPFEAANPDGMQTE